MTGTDAASPALSVVIVAVTGTASVERTMRHLRAQTARRAIEVIVVATSLDAVDAAALGASEFAAFRVVAVGQIEQRGRAAMGELDRIIAAIRGDEPEARAPLPGIDDLAGLIEGSREAGMTIDAVIDAPSVAGAVGRAAFAVVREALTNAAKHAPGTPVTVSVTTDADALAIRVANAASGPGLASAGGRRGIAGMRDRIGLLGGVSRIGPATGGGFEVLALLPLGASLAPASEPQSVWTELRETVAS